MRNFAQNNYRFDDQMKQHYLPEQPENMVFPQGQQGLILNGHISTYTNDKIIAIKDGQVFIKDILTGAQANLSDGQLIIRFFLPLDEGHDKYLMADQKFNLQIVTIKRLPNVTKHLYLQLRDIYQNNVALGDYNILSWKMSSQNRYICLYVKGLYSSYILLVDLATHLVVEKSIPITKIHNIVWSDEDRYLCLNNKHQAVIFEMQIGDFQKFNYDQGINNVFFSKEKFIVITQQLEAIVYRKADWVKIERPPWWRRVFFPQLAPSVSRVQFYLDKRAELVKSANMNNRIQDFSQNFQIFAIKIKSEIQRLVIYDQSCLWSANATQIGQKPEVQFDQVQDNYIQQLDERVKNIEPLDIKIMINQGKEDQLLKQISANIARLHELENGQLYISDQTINL